MAKKTGCESSCLVAASTTSTRRSLWTKARFGATSPATERGLREPQAPASRRQRQSPRRIPESIVQKAIALRQEVPTRSANTIIQILKRDPDYPPDLTLALRTLQGILQQRGITREKLVGQSKAFRRFERESANALWQGDMLVGPYLPDAERPGKYRRTALFCFIDDYSRLIPYGEFFFEETLPRLERVLKVAILRRGLPHFKSERSTPGALQPPRWQPTERNTALYRASNSRPVSGT